MDIITTPLQQLYETHLSEYGAQTTLERLFFQFEKTGTIDAPLLCELYSFLKQLSITKPLTSWEQVALWREFLQISFLSFFRKRDQRLSKMLFQIKDALPSYSFWSGFQLLEACECLSCCVLDQNPLPLAPRQLKSGAVPLEWEGYCSWAAIPHVIYHAELGVIWTVIAALQGNSTLTQASYQLALWQLNTLDHSCFPFPGLFVQEGDASCPQLLAYNYLLFNAQATLFGNTFFAPFAEMQLKYLEEIMQKQDVVIDPITLWLEKFLMNLSENRTPVTNLSFELPPVIFDEELGMIGHREEKRSCVFTVSGGRTGLGCYRQDALGVLSWGPQHSPLGDCWSFGIEGLSLSSPLMMSDEKEGAFSLSGEVRICSHQNPLAPIKRLKIDEKPHFWAQVKQHYKQGRVVLDLQFTGVDSLDALFFVFFLKGDEVLVGNEERLKSRSFGRYQGKKAPIILSAEGRELRFSPLTNFPNQMEVVPLAGEDNFWGADFLLAFRLSSSYSRYCWEWQ